jgi:signal transduction histidine kinase
LIIAVTTLLVPFYGIAYDNTIWSRLCVANALIALVMLTVITSLERALVSSLDTSSELTKALIGEREANQAQSKFLARMSHEIRTP